MPNQKIILGTAGMPGAGKSIAVNSAKQQGYHIIVMGNVVREEATKRQIDPTPENLGEIMLELRKQEGTKVIARRCIPKIQNTQRQKILIDGIRSIDETEEFKAHYPTFKLLAIHASPETRFKRLHNRKRSDDPKNKATFHDRDTRELTVGLGNAIALADYMVINETSFETAQKDIEEVLKRVEGKNG